jgi:hypothetical protein
MVGKAPRSAALLGSGLAFGALAITTGGSNVPLAVQAVVSMAAAGAIVARFRWAPLAGGVIGAAILVVTGIVPVARAYASYHLSHPAQATEFALTLLRIACLFVAAGAGIGAAVQNARVQDPHARRTPFGTGFAVATLAVLVAGATLVAMLFAAAGSGAAAKDTGGRSWCI